MTTRADHGHLRHKEYYTAFGISKEEVVNSGLIYRGWAPVGSLTSEPKWMIQRELIIAGVTTIEYVDDGDVNNVWDDRESLFGVVPFSNDYSTLFDGVNDYVDLGNNFNFERTEAFSHSFWVYLNSVSGNQTVYSKQLSTTAPGTRINLGSGRVELYLVNTQTTNQIRAQINSSGTIAAGVWKHCVITYSGSSDATGVKFYIDGVLFATATTTNNLTASILTSDTAKIGVVGTSSYLNGALDEYSIWNKELSAAEVLAIYNSGNPSNLANHSAYANLIAWWRMGDGDSYPVLTASKGLINGSMTNMASSAFIENTP